MSTAPTPIDALPTPPSTTDPANFDTRGDALLGALPDFVTQTNAAVLTAYDNAVETATFSATAEAARDAAIAVAGASMWDAATSYATGTAAISPTDLQTYRRQAPGGVDATDPALSALWRQAAMLTTQLGFRNRLINPFTENQRALTSVADDAYCLDRWYVLTESGNVTVAQTTDPESGAPFGIRLTQPDVTAKRIGLAQIIESKNIRQYASQAMNLFARAKLSAAAAIRYAIIEHTGTADVVTSDVVNNWASATFTPSNFFIAGINILKTGSVTPGAATWGDIDDWTALGASVQNVVIFFWTESALAQNGTLDINRPQYEPGVVSTPHEWRLDELALCQRYFERLVYSSSNLAALSGLLLSGSSNYFQWNFKQTKRAAPAMSLVSGAWVGATPTISANAEGALFSHASNYFYAQGSAGAIALTATTEL